MIQNDTNEFRVVEKDIILSPMVTQESINHHCKINTKIQYILNQYDLGIELFNTSKFYFNLEK